MDIMNGLLSWAVFLITLGLACYLIKDSSRLERDYGQKIQPHETGRRRQSAGPDLYGAFFCVLIVCLFIGFCIAPPFRLQCQPDGEIKICQRIY